jgi:hypothetical protein
MTAVAFWAVIAVWAAPAVAGLIDAFCWFAIAQQCTPIQWLAHDGARIGFAFVWTVVAPLLFAMVLS